LAAMLRALTARRVAQAPLRIRVKYGDEHYYASKASSLSPQTPHLSPARPSQRVADAYVVSPDRVNATLSPIRHEPSSAAARTPPARSLSPQPWRGAGGSRPSAPLALQPRARSPSPAAAHPQSQGSLTPGRPASPARSLWQGQQELRPPSLAPALRSDRVLGQVPFASYIALLVLPPRCERMASCRSGV
jgi:hypothetical protein